MAKHAALAQKMAAGQTIFLWLCRRRLHAQLTHQTLQRQQREAALARLQYEQECCARATMVNKRQ
jgi:hypothetical protein